MTENKNVFRRMLDSIVEGRSREAQRYVDFYLSNRGFETPGIDAKDASGRRKG